MSNLDDIVRRMKVTKVHGVPEPSVTQEDVYKGIYNAADAATYPSQYLNQAGSDIWKGDYGNQYGSEAMGSFFGLLPFLLANKHPLALIGGYVAPNVINGTLQDPSIKAKAEGKDVPNSDIAIALGNAAADLHPAMFVPKTVAEVLAKPVSTISKDAGTLLDSIRRFNIFNPYELAAQYGEDKDITKYVDDKYDDYKRNLKYAWKNDKKSLPFVASAGLWDYAIRSLFDNRLQDF